VTKSILYSTSPWYGKFPPGMMRARHQGDIWQAWQILFIDQNTNIPCFFSAWTAWHFRKWPRRWRSFLNKWMSASSENSRPFKLRVDSFGHWRFG